MKKAIVSKWMHNDYVRESDGIRKWYRTVLERGHNTLRVSRRAFKQAKYARAYKYRLLNRLIRLRQAQRRLEQDAEVQDE